MNHHVTAEFTRHLLNETSRDLHSMFSVTYGNFFTQHAVLFADLFNNLTLFYNDGEPAIDASLASFYQQLFVKMFSLLNPQLTLTPAYVRCVQSQMNTLKPFGGAPAKMQKQVCPCVLVKAFAGWPLDDRHAHVRAVAAGGA